MSASYYPLDRQNSNVDGLDSSPEFIRTNGGDVAGVETVVGSGDRAFFAPVEERSSIKNDGSTPTDAIVVVCGDAGSRTAMRRCLEVENVDVVEATSAETLTTLSLPKRRDF